MVVELLHSFGRRIEKHDMRSSVTGSYFAPPCKLIRGGKPQTSCCRHVGEWSHRVEERWSPAGMSRIIPGNTLGIRLAWPENILSLRRRPVSCKVSFWHDDGVPELGTATSGGGGGRQTDNKPCRSGAWRWRIHYIVWKGQVEIQLDHVSCAQQ